MKVLGLIAAGAALALPSAALAQGPASGSIRLTATVPVACWVKPQDGPMMVSNGQPSSGEVVEACNSGRGYQVSASYRPLQAGERARLRYAERMIDLPSVGHALLRQGNMAQIRKVSYQFDEVQLNAPLVLALTMQVL